MSHPRNGLLRWIAVFKLAKALMMIAVGIGVFKLARHDSEGALDQVVQRLGIDPGRRYIDLAIGKIINIPPERLKELGFASFVYAALFLTEGIGLWLGKRWAEWFTVIVTTSLIPLEIYEIYSHASAGKIVAFLINIAVVIYLVLRISKEQHQPAARSDAHADPQAGQP